MWRTHTHLRSCCVSCTNSYCLHFDAWNARSSPSIPICLEMNLKNVCVHIKNANVITYPDKRYKRGRAKTRCYAGFKKTCNIQCTRSASFGTPYDTMYLVGSFRQRLFCFSFSLHEESGRTPGVMVPLGRKEENVKTTRTSSMKT